MIHYHGTPLTPRETLYRMAGKHFCVSYADKRDGDVCLEIGHKVLGAMAIGGLLSYYMADPFVAYASVVAFMISEAVDWGVYTFTNKPLKQRILLSSLIGTPVDSAIFMLMLGFFSWYGLIIMFVSKMIGALIVWWMLDDSYEYEVL